MSFPPRAAALSFLNLGDRVRLSTSDEQSQVEYLGHSLRIAARLIVKKSKSLTLSQLQDLDERIVKLQQLYNADDYDYVLLSLSGLAAMESIKAKLDTLPGILLIQPDILQLQHKSTQTGVDNVGATSDVLAAYRLFNQGKRITGKGVNVAVIDDGFSLSHPALAGTRLVFSYDTVTQTTSVEPARASDTHGTMVAGILFAKSERLTGLVPEANFIAIRQPDTWTSSTLLAFQLAKLTQADVINCSWHTGWLLEPIKNVVDDLAATGRHHKGTAVVFAAGNQGREVAVNDTEAGILSAIVIGAVTPAGKLAGFSNRGSSLDGYALGTPILTTVPKNEYQMFSGTSLAAAIASGQIAAMIAKEPDIELTAIIHKLSEVKLPAPR
ncbi:S8 family serine peptidase [Shewanella salipaludis]|uniref:S8/S53 family peptidase n=1 Tax=Shewanella salipaludis TaxID=2723052 RepID=A0A972G0S6_9GAMM|nr:S8/S53 family peptidase [Shewanella salipaludis]